MQYHFARQARRPGHPIRRMLSPAANAVEAPKARRDDEDLKLFALSFTAFFVCIYTLIF